MNCQEFENILIDLAHRQILEATLRESGLAHTETCARCAARLADEQALSAGLRALAASTETEAAPPRLEAALRASFRAARAEAAAAEQALATAAVAFIQPPTKARHWPHWAWAAAAAILVTLALAAQSWLHPSSSGPVPNIVNSPPAPPTPAPSRRDLPPGIFPPPESQPASAPDLSPPPRLQRVNYRHHGSGSRGRRDPAPEIEIMTDFIPLVYNLDLEELEHAHIVHVRMPRSALVSFGLSMNVERAAEPVKADVVVGADGLARAIRFVH
jgi:hypothetical protein